MTMIKFNKYNVTDTKTGKKSRVSYSCDNHVSEKSCVTLYAKDYDDSLSAIFANATNASEFNTDYVVTDIVRIWANDPLYPAARARAEMERDIANAKYQAAYAARYAAA